MNIPSITPADLAAFHNKHFSPNLSHNFPQNITAAHTHEGHDSPKIYATDNIYDQTHIDDGDGAEEEDDDGDDGLGYYPDGVKRTLTDEQVLMFRHSEEEAVRREERHKLEALRQKKEEEEEDRILAEEQEENDEVVNEENGPGLMKEVDELPAEQQVAGITSVDNTLDVSAAIASHGVSSTDGQPERQGIARTDRNSGRTFLWPSITRS